MAAPWILRFAHALDGANHAYIWPIVLITGVASWIVGFALALKARRNRKPNVKLYYPPRYYTALTLFLAAIFSEFLIGFFIKWAAFEEVKPRLFAPVVSVTADGKPIRDFSSLVASLRSIHEPMGHHSHPAKFIQLSLTTAQGPLNLSLERDSGLPDEYWVSNPNFSEGYIGRVETKALDGF